MRKYKNDWVIFNWENTQNYWSLYGNNKKLFFSFVYEVYNITKKTLEKKGIEVIGDSADALWLNEKNIEKKLGHKNLPAITNKYNKIYRKCRYELVNKPIKQSNRIFLHINLALNIIMDCRTDKSSSF